MFYAAGGTDVLEDELRLQMPSRGYCLGVVTSVVTQGVICAVAPVRKSNLSLSRPQHAEDHYHESRETILI